MSKSKSEVKILFNGPKDITVHIDNIASVTPRGLELAFAKVDKAYRAMKGEVVRGRRIQEAMRAEAAAAAQAQEQRVEQLTSEELAAKREQAREDAFRRLEREQQFEALNNLKHDTEALMKQVGVDLGLQSVIKRIDGEMEKLAKQDSSERENESEAQQA